jgi:hypothetical protein
VHRSRRVLPAWLYGIGAVSDGLSIRHTLDDHSLLFAVLLSGGQPAPTRLPMHNMQWSNYHTMHALCGTYTVARACSSTYDRLLVQDALCSGCTSGTISFECSKTSIIAPTATVLFTVLSWMLLRVWRKLSWRNNQVAAAAPARVRFPAYTRIFTQNTYKVLERLQISFGVYSVSSSRFQRRARMYPDTCVRQPDDATGLAVKVLKQIIAGIYSPRQAELHSARTVLGYRLEPHPLSCPCRRRFNIDGGFKGLVEDATFVPAVVILAKTRLAIHPETAALSTSSSRSAGVSPATGTGVNREGEIDIPMVSLHLSQLGERNSLSAFMKRPPFYCNGGKQTGRRLLATELAPPGQVPCEDLVTMRAARTRTNYKPRTLSRLLVSICNV